MNLSTLRQKQRQVLVTKFLTHNIDTNLGRLEDGMFKDIFPDHRIKHRIPGIIDFVKKVDPDIIHFQEGREVPDLKLDSVSPFVDAFTSSYHVMVKKYNPGLKAFAYISCFKKSIYEILDHGSWYLTETPGKCNTLEQEAEYKDCSKDCPKDSLKDKMKGLVAKWRKVNGYEEFEKSVAWHLIKNTETGTVIACINCHLGVSKEHRFYAPLILNKLISLLKEKTKHIIVSGDFNTFQDDGGEEQAKLIEIELKDLVLTQYVKDHRVSMDDTESLDYPSTFHFFPYDFGLGGKFSVIKNDLDSLNQMFKETQNQQKSDLDSDLNVDQDPDQGIKKIRAKTLEIFEKCSQVIPGYPVSGQLDHIYASDEFKLRVFHMIPLWINGAESCPWNSKDLCQQILGHTQTYGMGQTHVPTLGSDHQPLYAEFELSESDDMGKNIDLRGKTEDDELMNDLR